MGEASEGNIPGLDQKKSLSIPMQKQISGEELNRFFGGRVGVLDPDTSQWNQDDYPHDSSPLDKEDKTNEQILAKSHNENKGVENELPELSADELKQLPPEEATNYLWGMLENGRVDALAKELDTIIEIYDRDVTDEEWKRRRENGVSAGDKVPLAHLTASAMDYLLEEINKRKDIYVSPQQIRTLYGFMHHPERSIYAVECLPSLIKLDEKNRKRDVNTYLHLADQVKQDLVSKIVDSRDKHELDIAEMMYEKLVFKNSIPPEKLHEIFLYAIIKATDPESRERVISALATKMSRKKLELILNAHIQESPEFKKTAEEFLVQAQEYLVPDLDTQEDLLEDMPLPFREAKDKLDELDLSENVRTAVSYLEGSYGGNTLLLWYTDLREYTDESVNSIQQRLGRMKGIDQVAETVKQNIVLQAERLLIAATEIKKNGKATAPLFGRLKTLYTIPDIENQFYILMEDVKFLIEENDQENIDFQKNMKVIDRYLFDPLEQERKQLTQVKTLVLDTNKGQSGYRQVNKGYLTTLLVEDVISEKSEVPYYLDDQPFEHANIAQMEMPHLGTYEILRGGEKHEELEPGIPKEYVRPDLVIVHFANEDQLDSYRESILRLSEDYRGFSEFEKPIIVFHCDGFVPPLRYKSYFQNFLFSSNIDDLRNQTQIAKEMLRLREKPEAFKPEGLSVMQELQYDESLDLREWEHKTADTYQSLKHILNRIQYRNELLKHNLFEIGSYSDTSEIPIRRIKTILDLGTGEGRIGGMLARLGFNVFGLDISTEILKRAKERLKEEGAGLRGEKEDNSLSYQAMQQLQREGLLPQAPLVDDEETEKHYLTAKGDIFKVFSELNTQVLNWHHTFPGVNRDAFFNVNPYSEYAFTDSSDMFADAGFDMLIFNWHTFCEIGDPVNQREVLGQILNVMERGAELVIEIPDRMVEPYFSKLEEYHKENSDKPFGTLQDDKPDGEGKFSARYFPGKEELIILLKSVGFECDLEKDVQTYFIKEKDEETGEERLALKELFITARKPTQ